MMSHEDMKAGLVERLEFNSAKAKEYLDLADSLADGHSTSGYGDGFRVTSPADNAPAIMALCALVEAHVSTAMMLREAAIDAGLR